ncbi:MAG: hypothetical protein HUJ18_13840 [Marinobacter sp.]|nr:hypothetical protein [Marinobacter sp.]
MITAIQRKKLFPLLVMMVALAGMTLSVVGEASSHGIAELAETPAMDLDGHPHSHDHHSHDAEEKPDIPLHHDSGNHTHESVDQLIICLVSSQPLAFRQPVPFAGDSPRSFRYRLERPPKASLIV